MSAPERPPEACTVTWSAGAGHLTVTCPHGRTWRYDVTPVGDRPLLHFLHELPWQLVPGSQWDEDGAEGVWSAVVVPLSAEKAGILYAAGGVETFRSAKRTDSSQLPSGD